MMIASSRRASHKQISLIASPIAAD